MNWFGIPFAPTLGRMSVIPSRFVDILYSINSFSCYSTSSFASTLIHTHIRTRTAARTHSIPFHSINVMVFSSAGCSLASFVICVIYSCSLNSFCSFVNFNSHKYSCMRSTQQNTIQTYGCCCCC